MRELKLLLCVPTIGFSVQGILIVFRMDYFPVILSLLFVAFQGAQGTGKEPWLVTLSKGECLLILLKASLASVFPLLFISVA